MQSSGIDSSSKILKGGGNTESSTAVEVKLVLNSLEIVGSGGIQKIVSNGREYLENCAGDRIKKIKKIIGIGQVKSL